MKYNVTYVLYARGKDKVVKNKVVEASCQEEASDFVILFCSSRLFDNIEITDVVPAEDSVDMYDELVSIVRDYFKGKTGDVVKRGEGLHLKDDFKEKIYSIISKQYSVDKTAMFGIIESLWFRHDPRFS